MKNLRLPLLLIICAFLFSSCLNSQELKWPPEFYNTTGFNNGHLNIQADTELEHHIRLLKSNRSRQDDEAFYQYKSKPLLSELSR